MPKLGKRTTRDGRHALKPGEVERPNGTFQYRWRENGRYYTVSSPTLQGLREKAREATRNSLDGLKAGHERDTLNDWYEKWRKTKTLRTTTLSNYMYNYERHVMPRLGKQKIKDIKFHTVVTFYKYLSEQYVSEQTHRHLSISTVDSIHNVLGQIFQLAVRADVIRTNPTNGAMRDLKLQSARTKKHALTPDEQARLWSVIRGTRWEAMFGIALLTGMRCGELCGLTWNDIDYETGRIHIRRTLSYKKNQLTGVMEWLATDPKTAAGIRDIPLTPEIRRLLELHKQIGIPCTQTVNGITGFIFGSRNGGGCCYQGITNRALHRIIDAANKDPKALKLPSFSTHTLRHTFVTNCARACIPLETVMALVGHADMSTTVEIYTDVQPDMKEKAARMLADYIAAHGLDAIAADDD